MQNSENKTIFIFSTKNKISWIEGTPILKLAKEAGGASAPSFWLITV